MASVRHAQQLGLALRVLIDEQHAKTHGGHEVAAGRVAHEHDRQRALETRGERGRVQADAATIVVAQLLVHVKAVVQPARVWMLGRFSIIDSDDHRVELHGNLVHVILVTLRVHRHKTAAVELQQHTRAIVHFLGPPAIVDEALDRVRLVESACRRGR